MILPHEDFVGVYPTHGAGSLCSTGISSTPSSTIGYERRHNPMVGPADVDAFARVLLTGPAGVPALLRPDAADEPSWPAAPRRAPAGSAATGVDEVRAEIATGALVIDLRSPSAHATSHVPGSLSIPAGSSFGTWLGWVVEHDRPLVLVLERRRLGRGDPPGAPDRPRGTDHPAPWRVPGWSETDAPVESGGRLTVDQLAARLQLGGREAPLVIDVRQLRRVRGRPRPGLLHLAAGSLPDRLDELPRDRPIATVCASGYRSSVAASPSSRRVP